MHFTILKTKQFQDWLHSETFKSQVQIEKRLSKIECEGHFGIIKFLENDVWEMKWGNGRRVYYAYLSKPKILILLGGNKNDQEYDIKQSQKILKKYAELEAP